jgi:hypothetical protein
MRRILGVKDVEVAVKGGSVFRRRRHGWADREMRGVDYVKSVQLVQKAVGPPMARRRQPSQ